MAQRSRGVSLRRIAVHGAEAVGDHVVEITVGLVAQAFLMIRRRMLHAAQGHHALAVALKPVARRAENVVAILAARQQFLR